MNVGQYDRLIRIERPGEERDLDSGVVVPGWLTVVDNMWANIQELTVSNGEVVVGEINIAKRPARIRIPYHASLVVDSSMRIILLDRGNRELRIVTQPIELGNRDALEFVAQEHTTQGAA